MGGKGCSVGLTYYKVIRDDPQIDFSFTVGNEFSLFPLLMNSNYFSEMNNVSYH